MKKMKLLVVFMLISFTVLNAQPPKTYNETQREKETKAYNDAYLKALQYNSNSPGNSNGGVDAKAAQELADLFAARAGRETSTQKEERLKKEKEDFALYARQAAIDHKNAVDRLNDEYARKMSIWQPMKQMYLASGFHEDEAGSLAYGHVVGSLSYDNSSSLYKYVENEVNYRAKIAFQEFNSKINKADFAELFFLLGDFKIAAWSCLLAIERLEKRFPEKKEILEPLGLLFTASYWGSAKEKQKGFCNDRGIIQTFMLDKFKVWMDKYPQAALKIASDSHPEDNPIKMWAIASYKKGNYDEAAGYALSTLTYKNDWGRDLSRSKDAVQSFVEITRHPKYKKMEIFSADNIREIAKNQQVSARMIVEWFCDIKTDDMTTRKKYIDDTYYFKCGSAYYEGGYDKILKTLGQAGDGDALNAYAMGVAFGKQKEKPKQSLEMWKAAAANGSAWAAYNLVAATGWGFKWYSKADIAAAGEIWLSLKPVTEDDKLIYAQKDAEVKRILAGN